MTDPTKPGPDADRIAELEREIVRAENQVALTPLGLSLLEAHRAELARLSNEQPKGGDVTGLGFTTLPGEEPGQFKPVPSPAPSPEPQDVREALEAVLRIVEEEPEYPGMQEEIKREIEAGFDWDSLKQYPLAEVAGQAIVLGCVETKKAIAAKIREHIAALAQSDAQPAGWQYRVREGNDWSRWFHCPESQRENFSGSTRFEVRALYIAPYRPDASVQRMADHCCVPEIDEPFFVLLGRDPQAPGLVEKWALDRQYCEPAEDEKWTSAAKTAVEMRAWKLVHPERGMSIEAFAKIAPPRPDASGLIEAAEWLEKRERELLLDSGVGSIDFQRGKKYALQETASHLRARAADRSAK